MTTTCDHDFRPMTDDEVGEIRKKTRTGRPNGAWLENVSQCAKCGAMEAGVSWYGQLHKAEVVESAGNPTVRWPTRQGSGSPGGMGMG